MGPSIVSNNLPTCSLPWRGSCNISSPAGLALASGLAATLTITHMLKSGDGIVCMDDVYGGERKAVQMMSLVQKGFLVRKRKNFVRALSVFFLHTRHKPLLPKSCLKSGVGGVVCWLYQTRPAQGCPETKHQSKSKAKNPWRDAVSIVYV